MSFLHINLPYGISKNNKGEWMVFNRNYLPLGYSKQPDNESYHVLDQKGINLPVYSKFNELTEEILLKLASDESAIKRDEKGSIYTVWFYTDGKNPLNNKDNFDLYIQRLEVLSKLLVKL